MKRLVLIIILLFFIIVFAGCSDIDVTCGVDENNNAFIKYEIKVLTDEIEASNATYINEALDTLEGHFEGIGFTTTREDFYLSAELKKPSSSYDSAVDTLKEMLTDENISVFYDVSVQKINTDFEQGYYVSLSADYSEWILGKGSANLPSDIKDQVEQYASGESGTLTLMLPANEAKSTNGQISMSGYTATTSVPIVLDEKIGIDLTTKVSGNGVIKNSLSASNMISYKIALAIFLCLITAALLVIMVIMLKRHFKLKKTSNSGDNRAHRR